jgi:hypothetical protein
VVGVEGPSHLAALVQPHEVTAGELTTDPWRASPDARVQAHWLHQPKLAKGQGEGSQVTLVNTTLVDSATLPTSPGGCADAESRHGCRVPSGCPRLWRQYPARMSDHPGWNNPRAVHAKLESKARMRRLWLRRSPFHRMDFFSRRVRMRGGRQAVLGMPQHRHYRTGRILHHVPHTRPCGHSALQLLEKVTGGDALTRCRWSALSVTTRSLVAPGLTDPRNGSGLARIASHLSNPMKKTKPPNWFGAACVAPPSLR